MFTDYVTADRRSSINSQVIKILVKWYDGAFYTSNKKKLLVVMNYSSKEAILVI